MQTQVKCPKDIKLCRKDVARIYGEIKKNKAAIRCDNTFCKIPLSLHTPNRHISAGDKADNPCDCLINAMVWGNLTCDDVYKIMDNMSDSELKNQIKYHLNELVRLKVSPKESVESASFGTYQWWKETIWGTNKFQNYIYIISATFSFIAFIYLAWFLLYHLFSRVSRKRSDLTTIILLIYSIVIAIVLISMLIANISLGFENKPETQEREEKNMLTILSFSSIVFGLLLIFSIVFVVAKFKFSKTFEMLGYIIIFTFVGFIIAFNFYFAFLIPQLLIVGIVLQRFIFRIADSTTISFASVWIIVGLIICISVIMIYIRLGIGSQTGIFIDECSEKEKKVKGFGYYLAPYSFLALTLLTLAIVAYNLKGKVTFGENAWGLYLAPIIVGLTETI